MATPSTTPISKNYKTTPPNLKYLGPNSVTPTTSQILSADNLNLPTYNFDTSDSESDNMSQLSRTKDHIKEKMKLQYSQIIDNARRIRDIEDKTTANTTKMRDLEDKRMANMMNLDEKMDPKTLKQHKIFTAQLDALKITAEENKKTLEYLVEMKNEVFLKIGEIKATIHEFRDDIKKDQD